MDARGGLSTADISRGDPAVDTTRLSISPNITTFSNGDKPIPANRIALSKLIHQISLFASHTLVSTQAIMTVGSTRLAFIRLIAVVLTDCTGFGEIRSFLAYIVDTAPVESIGADATFEDIVVDCVEGTLGTLSLEKELVASAFHCTSTTGSTSVARIANASAVFGVHVKRARVAVALSIHELKFSA